MIAPSRTSLEPSGSVSLNPMCTVFSASPRNESAPLTRSAPTTAPQRLPTPPTTSIASVMNVSSR